MVVSVKPRTAIIVYAVGFFVGWIGLYNPLVLKFAWFGLLIFSALGSLFGWFD